MRLIGCVHGSDGAFLLTCGFDSQMTRWRSPCSHQSSTGGGLGLLFGGSANTGDNVRPQKQSAGNITPGVRACKNLNPWLSKYFCVNKSLMSSQFCVPCHYYLRKRFAAQFLIDCRNILSQQLFLTSKDTHWLSWRKGPLLIWGLPGSIVLHSLRVPGPLWQDQSTVAILLSLPTINELQEATKKKAGLLCWTKKPSREDFFSNNPVN